MAGSAGRAILVRLSQGDAPVKELAAPFDLSGPAITKHLNVLARAGLISRSRDAQMRPCRLEPEGLAPAAQWMEQYRAMWQERLDRLDAFLKSMNTAPAPKARTAAPRKKPKPRKAGERRGRAQ